MIIFQDYNYLISVTLIWPWRFSLSIEITTSDMKYYISVYSIWLRAKTQPASLMTTCCPPPNPSEVAEPFLSVLWIGIAHLSSTSWTMRGSEQLNAEVEVCACVCVRACVCEGKSGGYDEAPRQKGRYYATIQLEAFFFKCPSVAFVTSSFHVTTRHLLLKFLNIFWNLPASCFIFSASLPFAGPIHSVPQVKGNQRNIAPPTLFHRLSPLSYTPQVHVLLFCIWN